MDSSLNFVENGGTERSRARFYVRFIAIFVFHELGLFPYRGVVVESEKRIDVMDLHKKARKSS